MTTSILSACAGDLTGYDIQVLKDYAINAPWEWRKLFDSVIAVVEDNGRELAKTRKKLSDLGLAVDEFIEETREEIKVNPKNLVITIGTGVAKLEKISEEVFK